MKFIAKEDVAAMLADHAAALRTNVARTDFEAVCENFRAVCGDIGALLGRPDFHGGFDEMASFQSSPAAMSLPGIALAIRWAAVDKLATYEAAKIGIGQPAWWHECWREET